MAELLLTIIIYVYIHLCVTLREAIQLKTCLWMFSNNKELSPSAARCTISQLETR